MDRIKEKMNQLRLEADDSAQKVEEMSAKMKALEQDNLAKEQEVTSLSHKNGLLEAEVEKLETMIKDFKKAAEDGTQHSSTNEALTRRLQLLEEEAEEADKTLREANEKYVADYYTFKSQDYLTWRLRQTDVKAGHFERKVQALESERDSWETKYEEMAKKYADIKKELEEFQAEIGNI
ncbi:tropomyosin-2 [Gnomoniopsis sp. IMI 355080]|nr:tropomyosin-2 [Gnomoniopsis sp. IMI 355080]